MAAVAYALAHLVLTDGRWSSVSVSRANLLRARRDLEDVLRAGRLSPEHITILAHRRADGGDVPGSDVNAKISHLVHVMCRRPEDQGQCSCCR